MYSAGNHGISERKIGDKIDKMDDTNEARSTVFISYATADQVFVRQLVANLEACGIDCWMAEKKLQIGDSIRGSISDALESAQYVIAVFSRNSLQSKWVIDELNAASAIEMRTREKLVLPLLLDIAPSDLPVFYQDRFCADFLKDATRAFMSLILVLKGQDPADNELSQRFWHWLGPSDDYIPDHVIASLLNVGEYLRPDGSFSIKRGLNTTSRYSAELVEDDLSYVYDQLSEEYGLIRYRIETMWKCPESCHVISGILTKKGLETLRRHSLVNTINSSQLPD